MGQGRIMKKIIILISLCSVITTHAADKDSVGASYGLISDSTYNLGSNYSITAGIDQSSAYDLFTNSSDEIESLNAWVGVAGKYGELKLGSHDSLDSLATTSADLQLRDSAYDLLMQDEDKVIESFTYSAGSKKLSLGAQVASGESDEKTSSTGLLLNAQSKSVEAAIGYRRVLDEAEAVKGRLTYKSRNNSRVRVDLVAEKVAIDSESSGTEVDSTTIMVGAKYKVTPNAYVAGQYGVVGFGGDVDLTPEELAENPDYNALSVEAGYSLSDKTSVYINHTQKSYDSGLQLPFADSLEGSQTNSIGVRLNW